MTRGPSGAAPSPPADLARRGLSLRRLALGTRLARIHRRVHAPIFFSPGPDAAGPLNRFDSASGGFGVLYAALSFDGAFVEAVLRNPARRSLGVGEIAERAFTPLRLTREVALVDLTGPGLQALGLDAAIFAGPYGPCGAWADALHADPRAPDGILYPSRHDPAEGCVALFDRAAPSLLAEMPTRPLAAMPEEIAGALRRYGKGLDPG